MAKEKAEKNKKTWAESRLEFIAEQKAKKK